MVGVSLYVRPIGAAKKLFSWKSVSAMPETASLYYAAVYISAAGELLYLAL